MKLEIYKDKYIYLYSNIFFTKGFTRTLVLDLKGNNFKFISNNFYETILLFKIHPIGYIIETNPYNVDVNELINFLLNNHYASLVDDITLFPDIKLKWESPCYINNAVIDINENSEHNFTKIAEELQALLCRHIQIRSYSQQTKDNICRLIEIFKDRDFYNIDFITKYDASMSTEEFLELAKCAPGISFIIHGSPENKFISSLLKGVYPTVGYVQYLSQHIDSSNNCGNICAPNFFYPHTVQDYMEGIVRNRCLNMKISIDVNGNIKNCPSMNFSYGNIKEKSLLEIVIQNKFKKYWLLKKDKIKVCKDCEYRYICNDCRAFVKGICDKPIKCNYNPYK